MSQPCEVERKEPGLSEDAKTRILMHGMHEETIFYNRINFFMLIEALLFTALVEANGFSPQNAGLARICASIGILVSLVWVLLQRSKGHRVKSMGERLRRDVPDFAESLAFHAELHPWRLPSTAILVWFPAACGVAWIALLVLRL